MQGFDAGDGKITAVDALGVLRVAVGLDTTMMGRTRALDLAIVANVKETLRDLTDAVNAIATKDRLAKLRDERLAIVKPALKAAFEALTPGRRRYYNIHISEAKQSATRAARVEKCVPKILAGKGLQDR